MLERKSGEALWRQIGDQIADEIAAQGLEPGSRLPTEPELASRFDVSRTTVRRAMSMLEDDGLVRIEQGRGTFVHEGIINYEISKRTRYSENLKRQGVDPSRITKRVEEIPASDLVAERLKITPGDLVVVVETLSLANETIISYGQMYYPSLRFPGFAQKRIEEGSISPVLQSYGIHDYTRLNTIITTRPPTDTEARALQQPRSRWVLCTQKVDVDEAGSPICFSEAVWAGDRVQFTVDNDPAEI
ncbi:phosphonate metabolism transcriptional regulator PhnF [Mesorhizobium tianshanense]|uniref:phosphonate metabolism transcriptional regulator PhnF n=1 Tax=Mesorhizobium tianshanense TaxID=39844 RepID=UPI0011A0DA36|nr:phosphonate metabolism transcriptional regulator PhnF [Mesorhizobium tianshanense]GLS34937.1 phosphonate metabolism transcriptional regulator PhnF [Mesorhizobium tianshanense]